MRQSLRQAVIALSLSPAAPFVERRLDYVADIFLLHFEIDETTANRGREVELGEAVAHYLTKAVPAGESLLHGALEEVWHDAIVVAAVAWLAHSLDDAALLEQSCVYAGAAFARAELLGDLVERHFALAEEEKSEYPAGDAAQSVGLVGDGKAFDEFVSILPQISRRAAAMGCSGSLGCHYHMIRLVQIERTPGESPFQVAPPDFAS